VSCRHCHEQIELVEDSSDDISDIIFNFVRCWILPLMLAGVPLQLFSREPFFATIGFLVLILWQLREYEATHYDLRLKLVEKSCETQSFPDK
jgi:hypothetical protein